MGEVKQMKNAGSQNLNLQQKFEVKVYFADFAENDSLTFIARNVNFQDGMMIIINDDLSISGFNKSTIDHFTVKNITDQEEEK